MIYFVQPSEGGPVKIGYTNNLDIRMTALRTSYGQDLVTLKAIPGDPGTEQALHSRFAGLRIGKTEQFRPGPELMGFLDLPTPEGWEATEPMPGRENGRVHPIQIRINEDDQVLIDRIRNTYGLRTVAQITRMCWTLVANTDPPYVSPKIEEPVW